jgi:hypothetical protein
MWRQETHGMFMLVMNAAMNFDHLQAGRKPATQSKAPADGDEELDTTQGAHAHHEN